MGFYCFFRNIQLPGYLRGAFAFHPAAFKYLFAFLRQLFYNTVDVVMEEAGIDLLIILGAYFAENIFGDSIPSFLAGDGLKYREFDGGSELLRQLPDLQFPPTVP